MKFCTLILLLLCIHVNSQIVCDSITKEPIQFVNITNREGLGTITNENGKFSIDYFKDSKYVEFSHLTYHIKKISRIGIGAQDTILLSPFVTNLTEVVVTNFGARDSIVKAINHIPKNLMFDPFNLFGFYRESVEEDGKGAMLTEVSFIAYNENGNNTGQKYQVEIIQGRRTDNYTSMNLDAVGGVATIVQNADMVRSRSRMFDLQKLSDYTFEYIGKIKPDENSIYIIGFAPSNGDIYNNNIGKIYLESKTMAIVQIETRKDPVKIRKIIESIKPKKNNTPFFKLIEANTIIKYRQANSKYFLSFIEVNNIREGTLGKKSHTYDMNAKYILTRVESTNPKRQSTNYNIKEGFNQQIREIPKLAEWNENNTLFFSEKEKEVLKEIKELKY